MEENQHTSRHRRAEHDKTNTKHTQSHACAVMHVHVRDTHPCIGIYPPSLRPVINGHVGCAFVSYSLFRTRSTTGRTSIAPALAFRARLSLSPSHLTSRQNHQCNQPIDAPTHALPASSLILAISSSCILYLKFPERIGCRASCRPLRVSFRVRPILLRLLLSSLPLSALRLWPYGPLLEPHSARILFV